MIRPQTPISKQELDRTLGSRVTLGYTTEQYIISYREINDPITLTDMVSYGSNNSFKQLHFNNCIFNDIVNIGDYQSAGSVFFDSCLFNENVISNYSNVVFKGKCQFKKDLTIFVNNESQTDIFNFFVENVLTIKGGANNLKLNNINKDNLIKNQKVFITASCIMYPSFRTDFQVD